MRSLLNEFVEFAERTAERIVFELELPNDRRSVKAAQTQLGVAGGVKYFHSGVFFKVRHASSS